VLLSVRPNSLSVAAAAGWVTLSKSNMAVIVNAVTIVPILVRFIEKPLIAYGFSFVKSDQGTP
jgi:hypothetical protein